MTTAAVDPSSPACSGHARREERDVFAALVAEGIDAAYVLQFEHDHDTLEELLADADSRHQTARIVDLIEDHILREESDLFPTAHLLLGSEAWATIAAAVAHHTPTSDL